MDGAMARRQYCAQPTAGAEAGERRLTRVTTAPISTALVSTALAIVAVDFNRNNSVAAMASRFAAQATGADARWRGEAAKRLGAMIEP